MKINILTPSWQGGNDIFPFKGAKQIKELYLQNTDVIEIPSTENSAPLEKDIVNYAEIKDMLVKGHQILNNLSFDKVFTVGGSCDGDIPVCDRLNQLYAGDLAILWIDAHGDLNTPKESETKLFYGMPARNLMGEGEKELTALLRKPIKPEQLINVGGRCLDKAEIEFMDKRNIAHISVEEVSESIEAVQKAIDKTGYKHVHLHLDVDVMDPKDYPETTVPVANGLKKETLLSLLNYLKEHNNVVGFSIYETYPTGKSEIIEQLINFGLNI